MERVIAYSPNDIELWKQEEPKLRVRLDEPFDPFSNEDFAGRDLSAIDFYIGRSFRLEDIGVGIVDYTRDRVLGFNPRWAKEKAATPLGPARLSYRFTLGPKTEGAIVPPLELGVGLFVRKDRHPPDELLEFPSHGKAILGRWERRIHDPELHALPLVIPRQFLLPEWREIRTLYLPEDPKVLSDLRVTFLSTDPKTRKQESTSPG